ncbi:MAG: hypothetical protein U0133_06350 [Gemmatimonadales bacterium]
MPSSDPVREVTSLVLGMTVVVMGGALRVEEDRVLADQQGVDLAAAAAADQQPVGPDVGDQAGERRR